MPLVAGVDSSTQSCKVVVRDTTTGELIRHGKARHPDGTEVDPEQWWTALQEALDNAGGIDDVEAIAVAGQQHGMVCLDEDGNVIRPALLWNDVRSAAAATSLVLESGEGNAEDGARYWAETTGTVPVASLTVTKLRWLAEYEPSNAARVAAVCLPHDWLSWRLAGYGPGTGRDGLAALRTDRSDASGTGYYSPARGEYLPNIVHSALGSVPLLPPVLGPAEPSGSTPAGVLIGPGAGDNAAAALGVGAKVGDIVVSLGTSGTVFAVSNTPTHDPSGLVAGFADATGNFLPLACTLNATRIFDATAAVLGLDLTELAELALTAPPGSEGLSLVPYFEGERTPNLPHATGLLQGMTLANYTRANLARAAFEGVVCSLADGLAAIQAQGVTAERIILVGGGAQSTAVQQIAAGVFALPVVVPAAGEYVADGAARQAAATLTGAFPQWAIDAAIVPPVPAAKCHREMLVRYRRAAALLHPTPAPA